MASSVARDVSRFTIPGAFIDMRRCAAFARRETFPDGGGWVRVESDPEMN
jgi:hypothetical protein